MKSFLKLVFATVIGFFLAIFLLFTFFASVGSASGGKVKTVEPNSILHLELKGDFPDLPVADPFDFDPFSGDFNTEAPMGVFELKEMLEHAAKDDKIKGILLNTDKVVAMPANTHEIRRALLAFKKSKKFIYAYSNSLSEQSVMLNAVADKSYLNPMGIVEFNGLSTEIMYYTGLFEKLKIKPMIFYAGEFKSATEPYRLKAMSPENRLQIEAFLNGIYDNYLSALSEEIKKSSDSLRVLANNLDVFMAEDAMKYGLVDGLKYEDELEAELKSKLGYKENDKLKLVSAGDYKKSYKTDKQEKSKNKIGVVYAEGNIVDGKGKNGEIGGQKYAKLISKLRMDKEIKAIVIRVNSPGGSAFASEQILREIKLAKKEKPVVISMGNLAASGGYYISTAADKIVAEPTTITGSIGVFGMFFNVGDALNSNLGLTFDRAKTSQYADFGSATRPWDEKENAKMTAMIQRTYSIFLNHVAEGRKMKVEDVDKIARGRVWLGQDALKIGLVDTLGSIQTAIDEAAKLAKLEKYELAKYPKIKNPFEAFMDMISGNKEDEMARMAQEIFGEDYQYYLQLIQMKKMEGVQAILPYTVHFK
jgi:protease-4